MDHDILNKFQGVSLKELGEAKLMNRVDTKFIAPAEVLPLLFEMALEDYFVVEIDGLRRMPYSTLYFDTEDAHMYYEHQRGKKTRQKIRIRSYEHSGISFLEIKDKNNKGRTSKTRVKLLPDSPIEEHSGFIADNSRYALENLLQRIENHFFRVTLVRKDFSERVTIDSSIGFNNLQTGLTAEIPHVSVIEWKRKRVAGFSPMRRILKTLGIRESSFSKYVVGMAMTDPALRRNRLKKKFRRIDSLASKKIS